MVELMISVGPFHCENITSGQKVIEVRKSKPNEPTPIKCLIYCTYGQLLYADYPNGADSKVIKLGDYKVSGKDKIGNMLNGKVIGEFVCNEIEYISPTFGYLDARCIGGSGYILDKCCLAAKELIEYGKGKSLYAWHISDLKIYDKPKELSEFYKPFKYDGDGLICGTKKEMNDIYEWDCETLFGKKYPEFDFENCGDCKNCPKTKDFYRIKRPPQSWCYCQI